MKIEKGNFFSDSIVTAGWSTRSLDNEHLLFSSLHDSHSVSLFRVRYRRNRRKGWRYHRLKVRSAFVHTSRLWDYCISTVMQSKLQGVSLLDKLDVNVDWICPLTLFLLIFILIRASVRNPPTLCIERYSVSIGIYFITT